MRRFASYAWKYGLPILVAIAVVYYFYDKLRSPELWADNFHVRPHWLLASGVFYLAAHAIWATNSVILLWNQGAHVHWLTGVRAYYVSQFGKYVPGKVWVILLRVRILGNIGISKTAIGITATYESLTSMAAGAMIGTLLLHTLTTEQAATGASGYSAYYVAPLALTPIGLVGLNRFINRVSRWRKGPNAPQLPRVKLHMVLLGLIITSAGWMLLGMSLWLALRGLGLDSIALTWDSYLHLTSINALAYVIGFVAFFMPAGGGVREFAMQTLLALELKTLLGPDSAAPVAAVAAIVLRLVWTTGELLVASLLYWFAPADATRPIDSTPSAENVHA